MGKAPQLYPNKRTFSQLKSSDFLRLIHNQQVANAVSDFYLLVESIETQNETIRNKTLEYMNEAGGVLDAEVPLQILKEKNSQYPAILNCYLKRRLQSISFYQVYKI